MIPGGCTKYLQPLHVCINKPFKQYFREFYDEWFRKGVFEYTSGGKIKAPSHLKQITWVVQAWGKVSKEVIINSFDVRGITTDNAAKIPCLRKEHDTDTEESIGNLGDLGKLNKHGTLLFMPRQQCSEYHCSLFFDLYQRMRGFHVAWAA